MGKRGPKTAEAENREPRDVVVGVCFTKKESDGLSRTASRLGFRSKSALIAYVLEPLVRDGFTAVSFFKLGLHFANLVKDHPEAKFASDQINIFRKYSMPDVEDVNREQI